MTGVLITLKLFIGAAIGTGLVNAVATLPAAVVPPAIPAVWTWMFMALLVVGLALTFQVRPKDFAWTVLGGLLARGAAADWGVAAALAGGGGYAFYTTLRTTAALCATAAGHGEEEARVASVWCWHLGIGAVLGTSLLLKAGQLLPVLPRGSHDDDEDDDDEDDDVDRHGSPNKDKHE